MRVRRETAREAFLQRTRGLQPERAFGLERPRWDGLVLDYSFLAAGEQPLSGGGHSAGPGGGAVGGALRPGGPRVGAPRGGPAPGAGPRGRGGGGGGGGGEAAVGGGVHPRPPRP